jgi:membrane protease YdiL (CAAX protease family)
MTQVQSRNLLAPGAGLIAMVAVPFVGEGLLAGLALGGSALAIVAWSMARPNAGSDVAVAGALTALGLRLTMGVPVLGWVLALSALVLVTRSRRAVAPPAGWANLGRVALGWIVPFALVPGLGLWAWAALLEPDLSRHLAMIPDLPLPLLLVGGLLFAASNAAGEELLFRGVLQTGLERLGRGPWVAIAVQAVVFGLCHYRGFPSGGTGVVMATGYGFALGLLRRHSGGLLAPWLAHVAADTTIFALLLAAR